MFAIKKIISSFLMPPGIFIFLLLLGGICMMRKKRWGAGFASFILAVVMWTTSMNYFGSMLIRGLEDNYTIPKHPEGEVIVLLGGGIADGAPDFSGIGSPSGDMMLRTVTAVRLQKLLNIPVIISGGAVYGNQLAPEAAVVRRFLTDLGVPGNQIIEEAKSRDTIENAEYTKKICAEYRYKKIILVTSAVHMGRSVAIFGNTGLDVLPFPADFKTWKGERYGWQDYLPEGFGGVTTAFHEYMGLLYFKSVYQVFH